MFFRLQAQAARAHTHTHTACITKCRDNKFGISMIRPFDYLPSAGLLAPPVLSTPPPICVTSANAIWKIVFYMPIAVFSLSQFMRIFIWTRPKPSTARHLEHAERAPADAGPYAHRTCGEEWGSEHTVHHPSIDRFQIDALVLTNSADGAAEKAIGVHDSRATTETTPRKANPAHTKYHLAMKFLLLLYGMRIWVCVRGVRVQTESIIIYITHKIYERNAINILFHYAVFMLVIYFIKFTYTYFAIPFLAFWLLWHRTAGDEFNERWQGVHSEHTRTHTQRRRNPTAWSDRSHRSHRK